MPRLTVPTRTNVARRPAARPKRPPLAVAPAPRVHGVETPAAPAAGDAATTEWPGLAPWTGSRMAANVAAWGAPFLRLPRLGRRWRIPVRYRIAGSEVLTLALLASVLLHLLVLAIRFSPMLLDRVLDRGPPLEVALVNAKSRTKPTKADVLAQANLDGGGNTDADRRAKSPLPVLPKEIPARDVAVATEQLEAVEQRTYELMTRLTDMPSLPNVPMAPRAEETPERPELLPTSAELLQRTLETMRLEAQIARDMDAYQKRPKRHFIGARAEEYRFARYVEDWRMKVERIGNLNYPAAARELKLYGNLVLTVSIRSDGTLEGVHVDRSSGHRLLDAAAVKIVEMGSPYAPFPAEVRRDTDILSISRTWTFTRGDELRAD
jgi:periplasmic protein TonB